MTDSRRLIKNTTIYALGDIIPRLLGFISFPILTQYLTPVDFGIVNYVGTLTTFLLTFGFLCINTYYLVFFYRCDNEEAQKKLLGNLSSFVILFNLVLLILFIFFGGALLRFFGSKIDFYPFVFVGILTNFFSIFAVLPSALFRLLEKPFLLTIINVSKGIFILFLTLILVVYFNYSALGVLYVNLLMNFLYSFVFIYISRNHIIWNINISQLTKVLRFSLPLLPGSLAYYITTISDKILIDKYLNLNELGIYSTAVTLALILNIFSYGAYKAFEPYIFKNWGSKNFIILFEKIRDTYVYILLIGVLCLSIFSKEFFQIMSNIKFHEAYWYVPLIIIGVYSSSLSMLYGTIITAKGKTKINSIVSIVGAIISISLNVLLLPILGLVSAAIVSSFALTVELFILIGYSRLELNHKKPLLSVLIVGVTIYFTVYFLSFEQILNAILFKILVVILLILTLSKTLVVNPIKMINIFKIN
jgi:O-antigen/teichoic acid export membrane protein